MAGKLPNRLRIDLLDFSNVHQNGRAAPSTVEFGGRFGTYDYMHRETHLPERVYMMGLGPPLSQMTLHGIL